MAAHGNPGSPCYLGAAGVPVPVSSPGLQSQGEGLQGLGGTPGTYLSCLSRMPPCLLGMACPHPLTPALRAHMVTSFLHQGPSLTQGRISWSGR